MLWKWLLLYVVGGTLSTQGVYLLFGPVRVVEDRRGWKSAVKRESPNSTSLRCVGDVEVVDDVPLVSNLLRAPLVRSAAAPKRETAQPPEAYGQQLEALSREIQQEMDKIRNLSLRYEMFKKNFRAKKTQENRSAWQPFWGPPQYDEESLPRLPYYQPFVPYQDEPDPMPFYQQPFEPFPPDEYDPLRTRVPYALPNETFDDPRRLKVPRYDPGYYYPPVYPSYPCNASPRPFREPFKPYDPPELFIEASSPLTYPKKITFETKNTRDVSYDDLQPTTLENDSIKQTFKSPKKANNKKRTDGYPTKLNYEALNKQSHNLMDATTAKIRRRQASMPKYFSIERA